MKRITTDLLNDMVEEAGRNPRRRTNHNIHESAQDPIQRYFIAARRDSYFRPHRHPAAAEFVIVVQGNFEVVVFDNDGRVAARILVGPGTKTVGFELPPGTWHSWVTVSDSGVFAEVKPGPYDPRTAAEFAPWSPAEETPAAAEFLDRMRLVPVGNPAA